MTANEEKLIKAGDELARVLGHQMRCPKISPAVPCTCGAGLQQAQAMNDWVKLIQEIEEA